MVGEQVEGCKLKDTTGGERVQQEKNPQDDAGFLSFAFFWLLKSKFCLFENVLRWLHPLLTRGHTKELDVGDLPGPRQQDKSQVTYYHDSPIFSFDKLRKIG